MLARILWYLDSLSSHQLKNVVKVGPSLAKRSGSAHEVSFKSLVLFYTPYKTHLLYYWRESSLLIGSISFHKSLCPPVLQINIA